MNSEIIRPLTSGLLLAGMRQMWRSQNWNLSNSGGGSRGLMMYIWRKNMHTKIALGALVILIASLLMSTPASFSNAGSNAGTATPAYGFDLSIVPDEQVADAYLANLVITELSSKTIVASPSIRFRAGEPAQTTSQEGSDVDFQFSVAVNKSASAAEYDITLLHANSIVSRSQGKISLKKS